jgi:hypothetical protein
MNYERRKSIAGPIFSYFADIPSGGREKMFFLIQDSWEEKSPIYRSIFTKQTKVFPMVALTSFEAFLLLDIALPENNTKSNKNKYNWSYFLVNSVAQALCTISHEDIIGHKISLFLDRDKTSDSEYRVSTVEEIYLSTDEDGHQSHYFVCRNKSNNWQSELSIKVENKLKDKYCIYRRDDFKQIAD